MQPLQFNCIYIIEGEAVLLIFKHIIIMKSKISSILLLLVILLASSTCDKSADKIKNDSDIELEDLPEPINIQLRGAETVMVKSDQEFAFDFFAQVFEEERNDLDENFMVSPFSLSMALAMTWNGSDGDTKLAIQETLGMGDWTDDEVNNYFKKLKEAFEKTDPSTELAIANSIWTNQNVEILPDFISLNQTYYNATVEPVDFASSATVGRINQWASNNTNGLIESVIEKTNASDLMYLLNALYFKGIWVSEFDTKNTTEMNFTDEDGNRSKVPMMHQEALFDYAENDLMQAVELPYGNKSFSMMVLLPKVGNEVMDITDALQQSDYWSNFYNKLSNSEVDLYIPKFNTEYSKKLNDVLTDMGMGIAFASDRANFSRMSDKDAFISLVTQDTYIATDEMGTEAAAVTTVGVGTTSINPEPNKVTFKADRPFIYIIHERSTGSILFMGVVKQF